MAFTNPREKHPSTQRAYMGLSVAVWQDTGVKNHTAIEAWGVGDAIATPISVAATKNTSLNISLPMPVVFGDNLGIDVLDTHSQIGTATKATTIYYTIVPV